MGFNVTLMTNNDPVILANKQPVTVLATSGDWKGRVDWLHPVFRVNCAASSMGGVNYCSIDACGFTRYYHVVSKVSVTDDLWDITCDADLRKTAYLQLLSASGIVARQEENYDMYLRDEQIPTGALKAVNIYNFTDTPFKGNHTEGGLAVNDNTIIMQVLGGY